MIPRLFFHTQAPLSYVTPAPFMCLNGGVALPFAGLRIIDWIEWLQAGGFRVKCENDGLGVFPKLGKQGVIHE